MTSRPKQFQHAIFVGSDRISYLRIQLIHNPQKPKCTGLFLNFSQIIQAFMRLSHLVPRKEQSASLLAVPGCETSNLTDQVACTAAQHKTSTILPSYLYFWSAVCACHSTFWPVKYVHAVNTTPLYASYLLDKRYK